MTSTDGIVLNVVDYGDYAGIVTIFSKNLGKISFFAPGIKKILSKNRLGCEPFSVGNFEIFLAKKSGKLSKLKRAVPITRFENVISNQWQLNIATFFAEIYRNYDFEYYNFKPNDVFQVFYFALHNLNNINNSVLKVFDFYTLKMLEFLGLQLNFKECIRCRSNKNLFAICADDGGFVCRECYNPQKDTKLNPNLLASVYTAIKLEYTEFENWVISSESANTLFQLLKQYLIDYLGIRINVLKFFERLDA